MRAGRRAEAASTRAPTVPVEVLWRELARVAPTLGIGGPRPALTAASHSDARQVGRQNPVKSRGIRGQTRRLLDSHVSINYLSDYACTLAIHMTNIILTTCIDEERYASGPHRLRQSARPPGPRARPIRASQQPLPRLELELGARAPGSSAKTQSAGPEEPQERPDGASEGGGLRGCRPSWPHWTRKERNHSSR